MQELASKRIIVPGVEIGGAAFPSLAHLAILMKST